MNHKITFLFSVLLILTWMPDIDGAIVVLAPTRTAAGGIQITQSITFIILQDGIVRNFVLNDWVVADQLKNPSIVSPLISISLNGGDSQQYSAEFYDNLASSFAGYTPGDGYFVVPSGLSVSAGDSITLNAGTYTLSPARDFNPLASQTFSGELFLTNSSGVQLSNLVALPEPATPVFACAPLLLLLFRRRRPPLRHPLRPAHPRQRRQLQSLRHPHHRQRTR